MSPLRYVNAGGARIGNVAPTDPLPVVCYDAEDRQAQPRGDALGPESISLPWPFTHSEVRIGRYAGAQIVALLCKIRMRKTAGRPD